MREGKRKKCERIMMNRANGHRQAGQELDACYDYAKSFSINNFRRIPIITSKLMKTAVLILCMSYLPKSLGSIFDTIPMENDITQCQDEKDQSHSCDMNQHHQKKTLNHSNDEYTNYKHKSVLKDGTPIDMMNFPMKEEQGFDISIINQSKHLYYIHSFLSNQEAETMQTFCAEPMRFKRSPQTGITNVNGVENKARTSLSCPLLFAHFYIQRLAEVEAKSSQLAQELKLTWKINQRAAKLLGVDTSQLEPFQLLKYNVGEFYKQHHDHRAYYDPDNGYPDRPYTLLLFLNDVEDGGELEFEKLGIQIIPRLGDAIVWRNVDDDGLVDNDMVHEAMPPKKGIKMAVNVWVRDKPFTEMRQATERQH